MSKLRFALICLISVLSTGGISALFQNPCLTIKNGRSLEELKLEADPDWDDQILFVDNSTFTSVFRRVLLPGEAVTVCSVYERGSPGGSFGFYLDGRFQFTVQNINLSTNRPLERIEVDDNREEFPYTMEDVGFLTARFVAHDWPSQGEKLRFLR